MVRLAAHIMTIPIGTLMKKPTRHEIQSASTPPSTRPMLAPTPAVAAYQATARVRSGPSLKLVDSSASDDGARIAAPAPCTARAMISHAADCARPIASDATVNSPRPKMNRRRRPRMSPARALSSSRPPKASVYAFCTHDSPVAVKPRPWRIFGSAVMTIEMSRTIIR